MPFQRSGKKQVKFMKNSVRNNCEQFRNEMWLYIDGSLSKDKRELRAQHLSDCSGCTTRLTTAQDTITLYEKVPLDDIDDKTYKTILHNATASPVSSADNNISHFTARSRSLSEIFGFYKLAFGGGLLAAAILLVFITFFNNPGLPEIETKISEEFLAWDFPGFKTKTANRQNQIVKLKTDGWDIYIVRKNSKENWRSALRAIQKQIRIMQKEVVSTSM